MLGFIIFIIASVLCWTWYTRTRPDEPPILPGAWPIIGHSFIQRSSDLWKTFKSVTNDCIKMGHQCYITIGPIKIYVLTDPDDINKVANICLDKDNLTRLFAEDLLGSGIFALPVSMWKKHRKLLTPTLNQQILDGFVPILNSQARRLVKQLAVEIDGEPFDQSHYIRPNFIETICLTLLDYEISEQDAKNYAQYFQRYLNYNIARFQKIWLYPKFLYQFSALKTSFDSSVKVLQDICNSVIREKKAQLLQKKCAINKENNVKTVLEVLIGSDEDEGELTDKEVLDDLNTLLIAGHDTTASVTVYALLLIGSYPEVQDKLYKELQEIFGNTDRDVEKQDFSKLVYLEAVLKETMRCYDVAPFIIRHIDREVKLKNCTLQPGHGCFLMLNAIHRHPMWGPDANEFKPERWLDRTTLPTNPNAFVAFSLGKRGCIGKTYAMMSLKLVFSHILRRYEIRSDHTKLVLKLDVLLKPVTGHEISLKDRMK